MDCVIALEFFDQLNDVPMFDPSQDRDFVLDRILSTFAFLLVYDLQSKLQFPCSETHRLISVISLGDERVQERIRDEEIRDDRRREANRE